MKRILNNHKDALLNNLIGDVEIIKNELLDYDIDKLKLIKAHAVALKESYSMNHTSIVFFSSMFGLISALTVIILTNIKTVRYWWVAVVGIVGTCASTIISTKRYKRRVAVATLIIETIEICIEEKKALKNTVLND